MEQKVRNFEIKIFIKILHIVRASGVRWMVR